MRALSAAAATALLALVAAFALSVGAGTSLAAGERTTAAAAKAKKCKRVKTPAASAKGKRRCGKRRGAPVAQPPTTPQPGSPGGGSGGGCNGLACGYGGIWKATLTMYPADNTSDIDLDLHIWEPNGNHAGFTPTGFENEIANATHFGDSHGTVAPTEVFETQGVNNYVDDTTIGVCYGNSYPQTNPAPLVEWTLEVKYEVGLSVFIDENHPGYVVMDQYGDRAGFTHGANPYIPADICDGA